MPDPILDPRYHHRHADVHHDQHGLRLQQRRARSRDDHRRHAVQRHPGHPGVPGPAPADPPRIALTAAVRPATKALDRLTVVVATSTSPSFAWNARHRFPRWRASLSRCPARSAAIRLPASPAGVPALRHDRSISKRRCIPISAAGNDRALRSGPPSYRSRVVVAVRRITLTTTHTHDPADRCANGPRRLRPPERRRTRRVPVSGGLASCGRESPLFIAGRSLATGLAQPPLANWRSRGTVAQSLRSLRPHHSLLSATPPPDP